MAKSSPDSYHASLEDYGRRLDQYLTSQIPDVSRARVQQLIDQEKVEVDGKAEKASFRLRGTETIHVLGPAQPPPLKAAPEDIELDVVFEDDHFAVVNKPAGMMVHAGAASTAEDDEEEDDQRTRGTLVNALLHRFNKLSKMGGELRPGIVHRLDKDTSGLIVVAKNDVAHRKLAEQFSSRVVKKKYIALVHGWPKQASGTVSASIGRDHNRRNRMSTRSKDGRTAVSHYKVIKELNTIYGKLALVEVTIETGRTHQIRVHMASLGHPVVGDTLYGAPTEMAPLDSAFFRAKKIDTKATRNREASEITRKMTEDAWNEPSSRSKKKTVKKTLARNQSLSLSSKPISLGRNFLHAAAIEFVHPKTGEKVAFERKIPAELDAFLRGLPHLKQ